MAGSVYWIGSDGNVWLKTSDGKTTNYGAPINAGQNGFDTGSLSAEAQAISDPNPQPVGASGNTGPAGALAGFDQQINNTNAAIDRLPGQQTAANTNIDNQTQTALDQLLLGRNQSQTAFDSNKHDTAVNYVGQKNNILSSAGSSLNSVLRLLGSRGAGGGSAFQFSAPGAVSRQATLQNNDAANTNAQNNRALDNNWNNYLTGYNNEVTGVQGQQKQNKESVANQIASSKANLLQSLAALMGQREQTAGGSGAQSVAAAQPYYDQANSLLGSVSNFVPSAIKYNTQAYNAPALSSYLQPTNQNINYQGSAPSNDYYSPSLTALLGGQKKQLGQG